MSSGEIVIEQKRIAFYDTEIVAMRVQSGAVYVPIRPMCETLGISWPAQQERIKRDQILAAVLKDVEVIMGEERATMASLPLDYLNGWLFGVNTIRVQPEVRERLIQYQAESYQVLIEAFGQPKQKKIDEAFLNSDTPESVAYQAILAMADMACKNLDFDQKIVDLERRIEALEAR